MAIAVSKEQIYEKWKQFTTEGFALKFLVLLFPKSKFTKNESNSQQLQRWYVVTTRCFQRANLRKMKAIHNSIGFLRKNCIAVSKEQIYEKWKQFTTIHTIIIQLCSCFQRANLRKMKAIHNSFLFFFYEFNSCFQRANLRKMKAIHNTFAALKYTQTAVSKEQIYEKWKQFTTISDQSD